MRMLLYIFQVSRVIMETTTHRVHLSRANILMFDSTGSSKPVHSIASNIATLLDVPYVKCDCSMLLPAQHIEPEL